MWKRVSGQENILEPPFKGKKIRKKMSSGAALYGCPTGGCRVFAPVRVGAVVVAPAFWGVRLRGGGACLRCELVYGKQWKERRKEGKWSSGSAVFASLEMEKAVGDGFVVVNFYRFVFIEKPEEEVAKHLAFLQGRDIHGRIYINKQGINAQYSGPCKDALAYVEWLKEDRRFSDVLVQMSHASNGHAFPRLKLRYKPSLVQLEGGISHLPLLDSTMRAVPLEPSEWRKKLLSINNVDDLPSESDTSDHDRSLLLLDVRNGYEWDIGHFDGARRPNVDCFRVTSFGLSESAPTCSDPLSGVDKERTDILMYCTGGIRCDVYSAILRQRGFQKLYTLKGGVSHYLESEGPVGWVGNLFVFDSRLSLPPSAYKPDSVVEEDVTVVPENNTFAKCYVCGSKVHEFRHRNCANLDCNLLFLSCSNCVEELHGCCCLECKCAPRLRPVFPQNQRYEKWHVYRDAGLHTLT